MTAHKSNDDCYSKFQLKQQEVQVCVTGKRQVRLPGLPSAQIS